MHVAICVSKAEEINDFYIKIIGMEELRSFTLNKSLAEKIFSVNKEIPVHLLKKGSLTLEIFIYPEKNTKAFDHICISTAHRKEMIQLANDEGYPVICIPREHNDLVFIGDKSGNLFEIKGT